MIIFSLAPPPLPDITRAQDETIVPCARCVVICMLHSRKRDGVYRGIPNQKCSSQSSPNPKSTNMYIQHVSGTCAPGKAQRDFAPCKNYTRSSTGRIRISTAPGRTECRPACRRPWPRRRRSCSSRRSTRRRTAGSKTTVRSGSVSQHASCGSAREEERRKTHDRPPAERCRPARSWCSPRRPAGSP